jgi:acyl transferase domain-containing protein
MVAKAALEDAGYDPGRVDRDRVGCILGVTGTLELVIPLGARLGHPIWRRALAEAGVPKDVADDVVRRIGDNYVGWQENSFPGLLGNVVAGRIANRLDLGGTNCVVDAACASSLSAVHLAALELQSGRSDLVLTGGVDTFNDIFMYMCFSKTPALSPTGDARPFDRDGDGTILGEGLGMVVLKRHCDARRDGDRIYAVLKAVGTSSDGRGNAVYTPRAAGQIKALRSAYRAAGVTPDTIELIEAHGTGTRVGDATEVEALTEVYADRGLPDNNPHSALGTPQSAWCALGSIKSQIGHTKAAAGAAGLIKTALALYHKVLPPTIKVRQPLVALEPGRSPFYVNAVKRPWLPRSDHPRRAGVSAFGFGGSNFHCVLEEAASTKAEIDWDADVQILAFTADSAATMAAEMAKWPADLSWQELSVRAAGARREWRPTAAHRLLLVVQRGRGYIGQLLESARREIRSSESAIGATVRHEDFGLRGGGVFYGCGDRAGKLAVLFPGQGAQYAGMLRDLACSFPVFFDTLAEGDRAFAARGSPDPAAARLSDCVYPIPAFDAAARQTQEDSLRDTRNAQPALGVVGLGAWRVLQSFGVRGDMFAGHSHGELTALCAAGRLDATDFFALSCLRGRLLSEGRGGAMLAVHAPADAIRTVLTAERLDLTIANKNAPTQAVLSGAAADIERAATAFAARQIRTTPLAVSSAFHSAAVADSVCPFRDALEQVAFRPGGAVFANSTASAYPDDAGAARDLVANQLVCPVDFVGEIEAMYAGGGRLFLEVGPGARLTGLVGQILHGRSHDARAVDASNGQCGGLFDLACVLAWLASHGWDVDLAAWNGGTVPQAPREAGKTALLVPICGANYVRQKPTLPAAASIPIARTQPGDNGDITPTMNGHRPDPDRSPLLPRHALPTTSTDVQPSVATDVAALNAALAVTRENLAALERMQDQTAQLQRQFLDGQDAAQRTIRLLVEQQQRLLQVSLGLGPPALSSEDVAILPGASPAPSTCRPDAAASTAGHDGAAAVDAKASLAADAMPPRITPAESAVSGRATIEALLLSIVSEKTGYPADTLDPGMALDADLGIDSIKRVEILSALQDRLPDAPPIKSEHLGTLRTLKDICAFLANGHHEPGGTPPAEPATSSRVANIEAVLASIMSEKTGYPPEMFEPGMALDADLGIDSIKRVEILSALQERLPDAPQIKSEHLGALHTLRDISAFLANGSGTGPALPGGSGGGENGRMGYGEASPVAMPSNRHTDSPDEHRQVSGAGTVPLSLAFERVLDLATHPVLKSYLVDGRPVLPMSLTLEWLAQAAVHQNPGLSFHGVDGLGVLHSVVLDGPAPTVRVAAGRVVKHAGHLTGPVELRSSGSDGRETVHARAEAILTATLPAAPRAAPPPLVDSYARPVDEVYQSLLFRGPELQGIKHIEGRGPTGIVASVRTAPPPAKWLTRPLRQCWLCDPLALDCAVQLLTVWSSERHGGGCLPRFTARYRQYRQAFPTDGLRIAVRVRRDLQTLVVADIEFLDSDGAVVARLEGLEAAIDASLQPAFRRECRVSREHEARGAGREA